MIQDLRAMIKVSCLQILHQTSYIPKLYIYYTIIRYLPSKFAPMSFNFTKSIVVLVFIACIPAISFAQKLTVYDQLVAVNSEWKNQPDVDPVLKNKPATVFSENELVRLHLEETEKLLRARDIVHLTAEQRKNRLSNLNTLHRYWKASLFPVNYIYENRQPVFIDQFNTYCAVGFLMKESGADDVARAIQQKQNYSYLADIDHPKLMQWVNQSGLDFGELSLIQPEYWYMWPCAITEMHYNNTGPDVNEYIEVHNAGFPCTGACGGLPQFTEIHFYNSANVLYKTLSVLNMSWIIHDPFNIYLYYQFPPGENFADTGKVVLIETLINDTVLVISYDASGITLKDYNPANPFTTHYAPKEDETTPVGTSITFCGLYPTSLNPGTWFADNKPATIGTVDSCTIDHVPVALTDFKYTINSKVIDLIWQTATENNTSYFDIERSADGIRYASIGRVAAAGNSNSLRNYRFTDSKPLYINHYRLKQVDNDGKSSYSKILFAKIPSASSLILLGNLVQNNLNIQVNTEQAAAATIIIYDFTGRQVRKLSTKNGNQTINVSALDCGKYIIRLHTNDGKVYSQQFVKGS